MDRVLPIVSVTCIAKLCIFFSLCGRYNYGTVQVTNATLDTSLFGSAYNFTYTADADTAGNLGESVSRIITIIDAEPITVTSLSIASSSGNNFARADQNLIITLETNSSNIANAIGTILSKTFTNSFTGGSANFTLIVQPDDIPFNIFIDTIRPSIKLDGNVSYSISQGTINPFIPNVTITDGDPNYSGNTLVPNSNGLVHFITTALPTTIRIQQMQILLEILERA